MYANSEEKEGTGPQSRVKVTREPVLFFVPHSPLLLGVHFTFFLFAWLASCATSTAGKEGFLNLLQTTVSDVLFFVLLGFYVLFSSLLVCSGGCGGERRKRTKTE